MKFRVVAVGKIKEKYLIRGIEEYQKRLRPYTGLEITEVKDSVLPNKLYQAEIEKVLIEEENRIKSKLSSRDYIIALDSEGSQFTSENFAQQIENLTLEGINQFTFIIGGTLGLSNSLKKEANMLLSFSKFTFPHQLMRLILTEQLYRAIKIIHNEPYHY
ncbi:23S rRNA (pseudouridine(1915)-N(3))-methyltransferase RlmH [Natranaerobius thermophilus]|uniref:Ribosomal RNA large subunit methyltransferase H n=1 Tax=Natranaerobius thermophilus (strain ATCC BAA-1301 / DSM 18059 / JW/NM-WN-LF) TaxID=457570 RepID=RLMH_NATTJ|nr:23S rRNA (pseudouridine(1915)-N(3))-methyltransferase RlmH [Natranaerobius thermophilus]B2A3L2.1 RecName: Full=Ribosomal RNA large subunit methyltransferase H; AltName: Full=23S rRNA (pseudouridine1915-N3)-methyltransferase; AltName: Full=23S rRNA m3Psi1915 methyltransferase; AltName: Full=rRNA (pseudouridine-N3-)-methyltransferase RlmH [Natranaerobius thermophilus JW/NM-WN-LF]ACB86441.1 protein of unknown function DUF163 [Natranaerobius thermophilus JW/NM-WN-LF]